MRIRLRSNGPELPALGTPLGVRNEPWRQPLLEPLSFPRHSSSTLATAGLSSAFRRLTSELCVCSPAIRRLRIRDREVCGRARDILSEADEEVEVLCNALLRGRGGAGTTEWRDALGVVVRRLDVAPGHTQVEIRRTLGEIGEEVVQFLAYL